jgi:hypothetical protein
MPSTSPKLDTKHIDDVAQLLSQVVDVRGSPLQTNELIDELSQLLWAVSSLDPDAESFLKHSRYVSDLVTLDPGPSSAPRRPRRAT